MDTVRTAVARAIGSRLDACKHGVGWVFRALRAAHRRAGHEGSVPHAPRGAVPNRDPGVVRINSDPVWEQAAVHHLAQDTVARILVNCTCPVAHVGPGSGGCRDERRGLSSRPQDSHLWALPDPYVNLSVHTAPDVRDRAASGRRVLD